jgi:alanyl-tRNA synthetase
MPANIHFWPLFGRESYYMDGNQIRDTFIKFFESKGHLHMPSASLIPAGDPTLLFTSAGMVPFKPFFMGEQIPPSRRLTTYQKSFRTTDIDEVGDHKHLTFFEMLGNFSIGDYFKKEAVAFAWELITQVFKLEPERIYVTIYLDDDEAYQIWRDDIGIPPQRIYRYGDKDNWWGPAGTEGPAGPCSELHYDGGADKGCGDLIPPDRLTEQLRQERDGAESRPVPGCHPNCDCERFVELWNLVFMQFYQDAQRNRTPLPAPSVDTGMGLERIAAVLQGKPNVYETDLFAPIVQRVCELSGKSYGADHDTDYAIRVVAEHARAACFLIGDGVVPGNEGRGYVLRRVIRRGIFYWRQRLDPHPYLPDVAAIVRDGMWQIYPELLDRWQHIRQVLEAEQGRFLSNLSVGTEVFEKAVVRQCNVLKEKLEESDWQLNIADSPVKDWWSSSLMPDNLQDALLVPLQDLLASLPGPSQITEDQRQRLIEVTHHIAGKAVFILYDTYGFPPELTAEIAREHGLDVDLEGFEREMVAQRERARAHQSFSGSMEMLTTYENLDVGRSYFVGYQQLQQESVVSAILVDGTSAGHAVQGQPVEVILEETPFYAESGGQVGDQGYIRAPNGVVRVEDTRSPVAGLIVHQGVVEQGEISLGEPVKAQVDITRRTDAARNHSGTHLLHAALRSVLGPHVRQAGSLVAPDRLRFDFSHVSPLSPDEQLSVQGLTNEKIRANLGVSTHETSYAEAVRQGALAFFGDRYGDVVRVVSMSNGEPFSVEVCGGTHVGATGQVGTLFVLGESSIGGGMRRIEAVTGRAAEQLFVDQAAKLEALSRRLQTPVADLEVRLDSFIQDTEELKRRLAALERATLRGEAERILEHVIDVEGIKVATGRTSATSAEAMREMGDFLKAKLSSAVVVLGAVVNSNPLIVTMVTPDLVAKGLHAGNIARDTAKVIGGGGGGQAEMAQAGGRQASKLDQSLQAVPELVRRELKS